MSLTATLNTAVSGLQAAQIGLRTVSDNISNVNTPGYVRKTVNQQQLVADGKGMGVEILGVRRVTDQYLQLASLTAAADSKRYGVIAEYLDNAQGLFGNPSGDSFFFSRLDDIWAAFAASADDPSSSLARSQAVANVEDFINEAARINGQIAELGRTVDAQIGADVSRANDLLREINRLNTDITRAKVTGGDASGSENAQSQLIDELSTLINVRISPRTQGGVTIRSQEGVVLASESGAATLVYNRTDATRGYISASSPTGGPPSDISITSGEIRGLLDLRDEELPALSGQLGEFMQRTAEAINAAHNASSTVPAQPTLAGRNTGLDQASAIGGFSGVSTVAIVNAAGVLQRRIDIDFTANTFSINGGGAVGFTDATFAADLNTALGGFGSASFSGGALTINAAPLGNGVAISEGTSSNAGKGFSHFMGLNDLIKSSGLTSYETGLTGTSPHGFTAGQLNLRLADADGKPLRHATITIPVGGDMNALLAALNNSITGVGLYGQYTLDAKGALNFTSTPPYHANVSVVSDTTTRGVGGASVSEMFGLGVGQRSTRASRFTISSAIVSDPTKLALARLDLTVAAGQPILRPGDGTGAAALAAAGESVMTYQPAGELGVVSMTLNRYAAEFGGSIGRKAAAAETRSKSSDAVQTEADQRRQSVEGVNIDEELVRLTTYQQAFNASARMIQAAKDMFDVLTGLL